jgi:RNA recognition motif-containing protein
LSNDTIKADIESFLSQYKDKITSIQLNDRKPYKATVIFKDYTSANNCRIDMNQKKLKDKTIRIMWDEKDFLQKNKDNKNNLYIKGIPKNKSARELFEYFYKFGDIFSFKYNEDDKGNSNGTAFLTYYNQDDAKKAINETNGKKIWDSDMEVQYQKNNHNINSDNNLKINISNLPDKFTDEDLTKLCEEFGKIQIVNINKGQKGKYAIVKFSNEQEAKNAIEKLNNKEIENKKIYVKEFKDNYYHNNNKHNYRQNYYYFNNNEPMMRFENVLENNNLYIRNIPYIVTQEDLKKTFGKFGNITSIKLEEDISETKDNKEKSEEKDKNKKFINKGYGYISFEKIESAKKALESLNGKYIEGFESWTKPLMIDYFISKDKRQNMIQSGVNYYGMQNNPMIFQTMPGQYMPYSPMFQMPISMPNQYKSTNMWNQGNYKNNNYNNYRPKYNGYQYRGRGGNRGGYHKNNNYQKKDNNNSKDNTNNNSNKNNINEKKKLFDFESFNKLTTIEEKKEFLGERLFAAIQEKSRDNGSNIDFETIGKITGMIIAIPDEKEIIEILQSPSSLDSRISEALTLLNKDK